MPNFADYAYQKLIDLYNNHSNEVGSKLYQSDPSAYSGYKKTDCITYAINVMEYAYNQMGNATAARKVRSLGKRGTELAKYLVENQNWVAVYINPDTRHPIDARDEHNFTATLVNSKKRKCKYYGIPVTYTAINYSPTPSTHYNFKKLVKKGITTLNNVDITKLATAKFGFGVMHGGNHTWLFSKGDVYEVHWNEIGSDLYEKTALKSYSQAKSGLIVFPPLVADNFSLTTTKCH